MNCFECKNKATCSHHVVPESRGGTKTVPLCDSCHNKAHHIDRNLSISQLTKEAMAKKKVRGERYTRSPPYGKMVALDGKTLIDNPIELLIIERIKEMKRKNFSFRYICKYLQENDYPTRGAKWHHNTVARMFKAIDSRCEAEPPSGW